MFKNFDLTELAKYIDWGPFFQTWDLAGPFPAILKDEVVGTEAVRVYADGQRMLKRLIEGRWLTASGVMGFWPANTRQRRRHRSSIPTSRASRWRMTWWGLRQQTEKQVIDGKMRPSRALADFVAPKGVAKDYVGMFAVTAGIGVEKKEKYFLDDLDDYSAIMLKALADRLAEAFAEALHERVRKDLWGYAPQESLANEDLIAEKYRGIRPAPGYPACPDHSVKRDDVRAFASAGNRHGTDREPGHDAGGQRQRLLPGPSRQHLLQRRQDRRGPAAGSGGTARRRRRAIEPPAGAQFVSLRISLSRGKLICRRGAWAGRYAGL